MDSSYVFLGVAGLLFLAFLFISFKSAKTRKLRIITAQTDEKNNFIVLEVVRKWNDGFNDKKDMMLVHQDGKNIWLPTHWIIRIEEM